jgi:tetratricopeptide (TPR) repeat protein
LEVSREAVALRQQLAADRPATFNADLASSLNALSYHLSNLGHREEALEIIREAVDLRRQLAADRPAVFNADLALSHHNHSLDWVIERKLQRLFERRWICVDNLQQTSLPPSMQLSHHHSIPFPLIYPI